MWIRLVFSLMHVHRGYPPAVPRGSNVEDGRVRRDIDVDVDVDEVRACGPSGRGVEG